MGTGYPDWHGRSIEIRADFDLFELFRPVKASPLCEQLAALKLKGGTKEG
jgi:hypothetical protein